jgi:hypothetical protein
VSAADRAGRAHSAASGGSTKTATPQGDEPVQARELRAVLDRGADLAALDALGLSLRWACDVLRGDATRTPAAALRAVAQADRALCTAPEFFAELSSLMERGEPAAEVAADLTRYAAQLAELDRLTAPRRNRLRELLDADARLQTAADSLDEVNARIAELERLQEVAAHLAELRGQRDRLEERLGTAAGAAADVEAGIVAATGPLLVATREALDTLTEHARERLRQAAEQDRLLQERIAEQREIAAQAAARTRAEQAKLATARERAAEELAKYQAAHADALGRTAALRRYQAANRAVADALAGRAAALTGSDAQDADPVAQALYALDGVQERLGEIDELLGAALAADEGEQRLVVLPGQARKERSAARPSPQGEDGVRS